MLCVLPVYCNLFLWNSVQFTWNVKSAYMHVLKHPSMATQWLCFCTCPPLMVRVTCLLKCETMRNPNQRWELWSFVFSDGTDITNGTPKRHRLHPNVTEVGSERPINTAGSQQHGHQSQSLQLFGPNVQPRHCVIAHTEGIVTVTPCSGNAETYVNGQRIYETTILQVTWSVSVPLVLVIS